MKTSSIAVSAFQKDGKSSGYMGNTLNKISLFHNNAQFFIKSGGDPFLDLTLFVLHSLIFKVRLESISTYNRKIFFPKPNVSRGIRAYKPKNVVESVVL